MLEIVSEKPVEDVTRQDLTELRSILSKLPPRASVKRPGDTLRVVAERNERDGGPRLSDTTVRNQLIWVAAIFNFALREQLIVTSPAKQLDIGDASRGRTRRPSWSTGDLNRLFQSPTFTGQDLEPAHFWVPLLALFQGLRLNEACQLYADDLIEVDGVPALRIAYNHDRKQRNKADETRIVPVHPELLALGLARLFHLNEGGQPAYIFPNLSRDDEGSATNAYSKWFLRTIRRNGIDTPNLVFHSFRHTFVVALRRAGVSAEHGDALGGWTTQASARKGYGDGYQPADLLPELARVTYPGLDLSSVVPTF